MSTSLLKFSKRTDDLLAEAAPAPFELPGGTAKKLDLEAPRTNTANVSHELVAPGSRMTQSIGTIVNAKRLLGGDGQAEQLLLDLNSASQINRGPEGVFESSRLHFDMVLGRDSIITPSDYLNFDSKMKM